MCTCIQCYSLDNVPGGKSLVTHASQIPVYKGAF